MQNEKPYSVVAGKYETLNGTCEPNIKYADNFSTLEEAKAALEKLRGYHFRELRDDDGNELDIETGQRLFE